MGRRSTNRGCKNETLKSEDQFCSPGSIGKQTTEDVATVKPHSFLFLGSSQHSSQQEDCPLQLSTTGILGCATRTPVFRINPTRQCGVCAAQAAKERSGLQRRHR